MEKGVQEDNEDMVRRMKRWTQWEALNHMLERLVERWEGRLMKVERGCLRRALNSDQRASTRVVSESEDQSPSLAA